MKTPYVPHFFGADILTKTEGRLGWATVSVASSIAWPQEDVLVEYDSVEYILHGARQEGAHRFAPAISTPAADQQHFDEALSRLYRFTSILGFFKRGYVDITGRMWGTHMNRYAAAPDAITALLQGGEKSFSCNHMPVIEDDQVRKALAFFREGRRLERVHEPYSFLSFFKVLESQFNTAPQRVAWINQNLDAITEGRALTRINELRGQNINVSEHLYQSGRCAVAHASVDGNIIDPDIPADRRRITADLDIIDALANRYIKIDAGVPDEMDLYKTRDRTAPWHALMTAEALATLKAGGVVEDIEGLGSLNGANVSVRLWPDQSPQQFQKMTLLPVGGGNGIVKLIALSARETIILAFVMDVAAGRVHTLLNESGMRADIQITEEDVEDFTRYFHSVVGNRTVELSIDGVEPVNCEVVIPVNIIPRAPEEAVAQALEQFRQTKPA